MGEDLRLEDLSPHLMIGKRSATSKTSGSVYLFSSGARSLYKEDIFNTLAYPPGFVIQFRYREPWVDDRIEDPEELKGLNSIVVASPKVYDSEEEHIGYNYYPLRRGEIVQAKRRGGGIHVHCKLGPELVIYPGEKERDPGRPLSHDSELVEEEVQDSHPGKLIREIDRRPRMSSEDANDVFISLGPKLDFSFLDAEGSAEQQWLKQEDQWVTLTEFLAVDDFFKGELFYRITQIQPIKNTIGYKFSNPRRWLWKRCRAKPIFTETSSGYMIDSGGQYRMDISLAFGGEPPETADEDKLSINSPDLIETFPSEIELGFRTDERSIIVNPTSVASHYYSALEIELDDSNRGYISPKLDIKLDLYPTFTRRIGAFLLLVFGVVLLVSSTIVAEWLSRWMTENLPGVSPSPQFLIAALTIGGLTAIMLAYRIWGRG